MQINVFSPVWTRMCFIKFPFFRHFELPKVSRPSVNFHVFYEITLSFKLFMTFEAFKWPLFRMYVVYMLLQDVVVIEFFRTLVAFKFFFCCVSSICVFKECSLVYFFGHLLHSYTFPLWHVHVFIEITFPFEAQMTYIAFERSLFRMYVFHEFLQINFRLEFSGTLGACKFSLSRMNTFALRLVSFT